MATDINDFLARKRAEGRKDPAVIPGRANLRTSVALNPDQEAENNRLAQQYNVPPAVVRENPTLWKERELNDNAQNVLDRSRRLGEWLADSRNAAVANDDIETLSQVEGSIPLTAAERLRRQNYWEKRLQNGGNIRARKREKGGFWSSIAAIATGISELPDLWMNSILAQTADLFGSSRQVFNKETGQFEWRQNSAADNEKVVMDRVRRAQRSVSRIQQAKPEFETMTGDAVFDGVYSLTLMAPGMAAGLATRNPTIPLMTAAALTEPEAYVKYRARGGSTEEAFSGAGLETAAEVGFELIPMSRFVSGFGKGQAAKFLKDYFIAEGLSEQATTLAQDAIDTAIANPDKTWSEYLQERPEAAYRTAIATLVMSGAVATADTTARHFQAQAERAAEGLQTADFVTKLQEIAEASKLQERDVSSFENWVETAAQDSGAEAVYIEANKLTEVLAQSGLDPQAITEALPSLQDTLTEAIATNGDVKIPISEIAARSGELGAAITPHLRINPEDMSQAEAEVFMQSAKEDFREQTQEALAQAEINDEFAASADRVQQQVFEQLEATGRFTSDVNQAYASLHASFFSSLARDLGITPEQAAAQYPLQIQSEAESGEGFDQDSDAFKNWFGDSKVVDDSGKPLVVYHGTGEKFEAFDPDMSIGGMHWFTNNKQDIEDRKVGASGFGEIVEAYVSIKNPAGWSEYDKYTLDQLLQMGHDGLILPEKDGTKTVVAFNPEQIKSVNNRGTFDPNDPNILNQEGAPIFYSALAKAIENSKQPRAPAAQWKATLQKAPGVKQEELEWSGLLEMFDFDPKAVFTREQLAEAVEKGGIVVDEVVLGPLDEYYYEDEDYQRIEQEEMEAALENADLPHHFVEEEVLDLDPDDTDSAVRYTVFGEYADEGESYSDFETANQRAEELNNDAREAYQEQLEHYGYIREIVDERYQSEIASEKETQFQEWSLSEDTDTYRELLLTLPVGKGRNPERSPGTHWSQPHVVAHLRFAEKDDADGNKVMFIEEVQSDWHQKGRDDGYETPSDPEKIEEATRKRDEAQAAYFDRAQELFEKASEYLPSDMVEEIREDGNPLRRTFQIQNWFSNVLHKRLRDLGEEYKPETNEQRYVLVRDLNIFRRVTEGRTPPYMQEEEADVFEKLTEDQIASAKATPHPYRDLLEDFKEVKELDAQFTLRNTELRVFETPTGVPNAPFKSSWPALVMKRAIRWAADNGFERVAWTTGEQQADRYNLGTVIPHMLVSRYDENMLLYDLGSYDAAKTVADNSSHEAIQKGFAVALTKEGAIEAFGKDIANRSFEIGWEDGNPQEVEIEDLRIGGEGMKAFYDRNLPNITNRIIKKHGAKVVPMRLPEFSDIDDTRARQRVSLQNDIASRELDLKYAAGDEDLISLGVLPESARDNIEAETAQFLKNTRAQLKAARGALDAMGEPSTLAELRAVRSSSMKSVVGGKHDNHTVHITSREQHQQLVQYYEDLVARGHDLASERLDQLRDIPDDYFDTIEEYDRRIEEMRNELPPTNLGFDLTDDLQEAATGGFPLFQNTGAPRGQLARGKDGNPAVISLLRGADLSTFLHESGHYFLEVMADVARSPDAPTRIRQDFRQYLSWSGVRSIGDWHRMTLEQQREHHERFARGFEAYLFEGRAPSVEAQTLFQRFRTWLVNVYRNISRLDVELTDEMRGVFDRMLASEEQIKEVEQLHGIEPFLTQKPEAMTDGEWETYQALNNDATEEAIANLQARSLRDMRYAGNAAGQELKRLQKEVKKRRKTMREEVREDMAEDPIYRAVRYLRNGEMNGEPTDNAVKLSWAAIKEMHTDKSAEELQRMRKTLGTGKYGMLGKDGATPDEIAPLFGFSSGDHLVQELLLSPKTEDMIDAETDVRMVERYGDINSPEALKRAVDEAIHNKVRGRFIATEYAALRKAQGQNTRVVNAAAKRLAADTISRLRIRDIKPSKYEAAERRAAKAAQEAAAKDEIAKATAEKRNQLFNFHGAREARGALEEVDKTVRYFKKFEREGVRKNLDHEYRDQIDKLLERFDLRTGVTNKAADKRKSLLAWVERQEANGFTPAIDDALLDEARRQPYKQLTMEEMRGLKDTIRNIEHLARLKKKLLTAKDEREFADAVEDIETSIRHNAYKQVDIPIGAKRWSERVKSGVNDLFVAHRKFANLAFTLDGQEYGPMWERLIRPMNEAGDREAAMNEEATIALAQIFKTIEKQNTTSREYVPEIGTSLSLEDRLMVALNMGNEGNLQRLMEGDSWEREQLDAVVAPLTAEHWTFVQQVWDFIDGYWPQIRDKELRVTGIAPEKVAAMPLQRVLEDGTEISLRGGYFPIKYDPDRSSKAEADDRSEVLKQMIGGKYVSAQTRRGHTKARVDSVDRPVRKDFGVIFEHIAQVAHDLSWHEYLIDANRLIKSNAIDAAIRDTQGPNTLRWIKKSLEDIAVGDLPAQNVMERTFNHLRAGVSIAGLGWNLWTSLLQPVGLTQSASRIGTQWVLKGAGRMIGDAAHLENTASWVFENSDFMRLRAKTMQREINEIRNKISDKSPLRKTIDKAIPSAVGDAIADSYFVFIAKAQLMADLPTWIGQYEKSMEGGVDEATAMRQADQAVIDSQGGGQIKDLAGVQRGSPIWKLFTNFYSYFNVTYNLLVDRSAKLRRIGPTDLPYFMVDSLMLTALPATITALMYEALKGDGEWEDMEKKILQENISYMMGLMVGVREVGSAFGDNAGMYKGPAGARVFAELNRLGQQAQQGEVDEAFLRAANSAGGIILHYPSGQVDRTVRGIDAMIEEDAGPLAPLVGPPR